MRYETLDQFWQRVKAEGRLQAAEDRQAALKAEERRYAQIASMLIQEFQPQGGEETRLCPPHMKKKLEAQSASPETTEGSGVKSFMPMKDLTEGGESKSLAAIKDLPPGRIDWKAEIEWAYQHLNEQFPREPPSPGAKSLHRWARENTSEFFRTFVTRLLPVRPKEDVDQREEDDGRVLHLIDRVLGKMGKGHAENGANGAGALPAALAGEGPDGSGPGTGGRAGG